MRKAIVIGTLVAGLVMASPVSANAATVKANALAVAKQQLGDPYRYGATGPNSFDCSGLTYYSYKKAHKAIPRTAQAQYNKTTHISAKSAQKGDLVFFGSSSKNISHVGIYDGGGYMIHANAGSYYGRKVIKERISFWWSKHEHVYYGRVK